jgi:hypothetical protein
MSERSRSSRSLTRRDVVKGAVALATLGGGSALTGRDVAAAAASAAGRDRVAIIGAGAGGVAAAYFLAGTHAVELFEARSKIGGHCDSHVIDYRGKRITVDLGAQFFHPGTHPIYVTLLEQLGLYDPAHPNAADTLEAPGYLKFDLEAASATDLDLRTSLEDCHQTNPAVSSNPIQVNQTLNSTAMNGVLPVNNTIWLRMTKHGYTYTTSYSLDGTLGFSCGRPGRP